MITGLVISLMKDMERLKLRQTGSEQFNDTLERERECFRESLGLLYRPLLRLFGLTEISNRKDKCLAVNEC